MWLQRFSLPAGALVCVALLASPVCAAGVHVRELHAVDVTYAPGASSKQHTHPCAVIGYVLEGAVRERTGNGRKRTYGAGQSFYEAPNSTHRVSANASSRVPARFIATFIC